CSQRLLLLLQISSILNNKSVNRMYYLIAQEKNWTEALIYCRIHYTNLISIQSYEDDMFISQKFDSNVPLWIGLYNKKDKFIYTHWKDKEPNAQPGSVICVAMSNGQWFDNYCNQTYRFVCYKDRGYHLIDQKKSWFEARNHCRKQHTDLASIRNPEELEVFTSMFDRDPQGRTYHRVNQKKSWTEARDYCRNFYTDLISIRSPQEQKRTAKLFTGDTPLWIGLYNNNKRPTAGWKWINGDKFNNDQWRHAELDNSGPRICMAFFQWVIIPSKNNNNLVI
uniref:C-type lectin domain-containing protein n=1 Tax=Callorhinchus milii TaxID=7868 RepID=A0A4W3IHG5_CALMI